MIARILLVGVGLGLVGIVAGCSVLMWSDPQPTQTVVEKVIPDERLAR